MKEKKEFAYAEYDNKIYDWGQYQNILNYEYENIHNSPVTTIKLSKSEMGEYLENLYRGKR